MRPGASPGLVRLIHLAYSFAYWLQPQYNPPATMCTLYLRDIVRHKIPVFIPWNAILISSSPSLVFVSLGLSRAERQTQRPLLVAI